MTKIMTPSETGITTGQIGKIQEVLGAALRKSGFQSEPVQQVLETQGDSLAAELIAVVRKRVEAVSNVIVRHVKVDRSQMPQQVLNATGRKQYTTQSVVDAMPRGEEDEGDVVFFKPRPESYDKNGLISDDNLEKEFEFYGLKPCDPYKLSKVNTDDPAFADKHPNATHWKDENNNWCYTAFYRWYDERRVYVDRHDHDWYDHWWFAGLRK